LPAETPLSTATLTAALPLATPPPTAKFPACSIQLPDSCWLVAVAKSSLKGSVALVSESVEPLKLSIATPAEARIPADPDPRAASCAYAMIALLKNSFSDDPAISKRKVPVPLPMVVTSSGVSLPGWMRDSDAWNNPSTRVTFARYALSLPGAPEYLPTSRPTAHRRSD
jgi:hypothetical protein